MDAFGFYDGNNNNNNNQIKPFFFCFREIKKLFRIVEIFFILVFATWVSRVLPFVVRISAEYFRLLLNVVVNPLFIFLLANSIALTLFYKSRNLSRHNEIQTVDLDFIDVGPSYFAGEINVPIVLSEVVFQDKETILEVKTKANNDNKEVVNNTKVCKRSQSENFSRKEKSVVEEKKLRRSETEMRQRIAEEEQVEVVNEMSNEEFQRAIEDFIAKQIKFHKEEKLAIVVHDSTNVIAN